VNAKSSSSARVLGVIAARGGSKGLPRKNVLPLGGKPLIAWSIEAAAQSEMLTDCVVSTDCDEITAAAEAAGGQVPFRRPDELADDTASIIDVVLHAVDEMGGGYDIVVLLQATSPFRTVADIDDCVRRLLTTGAPSCITVCKSCKSPYWMMLRHENGELNPLISDDRGEIISRRQDLSQTYQPTGAVYAARVDWLRDSGNFYGIGMQSILMPPERSVDIDSQLDFSVAQTCLETTSVVKEIS
jgi:CMP-N,N'-diacetyllegionaminic acid synthase